MHCYVVLLAGLQRQHQGLSPRCFTGKRGIVSGLTAQALCFLPSFREILNHQKLAGHPHIIELRDVFLTRWESYIQHVTCSAAGVNAAAQMAVASRVSMLKGSCGNWSCVHWQTAARQVPHHLPPPIQITTFCSKRPPGSGDGLCKRWRHVAGYGPSHIYAGMAENVYHMR
jgi:hypothetical protein